jgi:hypothetical protein
VTLTKAKGFLHPFKALQFTVFFNHVPLKEQIFGFPFFAAQQAARFSQ